MRSVRNCNVCVVGGAGFLGSHLVNHLIEDRECRVLVVDNLVVGKREFVHPKAHFAHHDITGSESYLRWLFEEHDWIQGRCGPLYVFNYAAYPYIPDSFARPLHVSNVNFFGAMKVINAAQEAGCAGILQVSSAEIYGGYDGENYAMTQRIPEHGEIEPHSTYGASKAAIDYFVQARWKEAKTPCIALRQFNCVGERETHPYVVPEIISQLSKFSVEGGWPRHDPKIQCDKFLCLPEENDGHYVKAPTVYLGNNSFRDFLYAGDAVRIAVELMEKGEFGEVVNLGSETGVKIYELAGIIGRIMGFDKVEVIPDKSRVRPWEIWHLQASNEKLYKILGHKPEITGLEEALRRTVKWFQSQGNKWCWEPDSGVR